jgi:hypothetical protein
VGGPAYAFETTTDAIQKSERNQLGRILRTHTRIRLEEPDSSGVLDRRPDELEPETHAWPPSYALEAPIVSATM